MSVAGHEGGRWGPFGCILLPAVFICVLALLHDIRSLHSHGPLLSYVLLYYYNYRYSSTSSSKTSALSLFSCRAIFTGLAGSCSLRLQTRALPFSLAVPHSGLVFYIKRLRSNAPRRRSCQL